MASNRLILDTDGGVDDAPGAAAVLIAAGRAAGRHHDRVRQCEPGRGHQERCSPRLPSPARPFQFTRARPSRSPRTGSTPTTSTARMGWAARRVPRGPPRSPDRTPSAPGRRRCRPRRRRPIPSIFMMIGPLTNLALALQRAPGITGGIGRLVIMGGSMIHGRGNVTPAAEFSIFSPTPRRPPWSSRAAAIDTDGRSLGAIAWRTLLAGAEIDRMFGARDRQRLQGLRPGAGPARAGKARPQRPGRLLLLHRSAGRRRRSSSPAW